MKAPRAPCKKHGALGAYAVKSVVAAAGKQNDGNDDQPKGTVIKKIAKAVIHKSFLPKNRSRNTEVFLCYYSMSKGAKCARKTSYFADF